jgi:hypothetical protein
MTPEIVTQPETQYVIHRGDSYVRLTHHGTRLVAVMVRCASEASRFETKGAAILAAMESEIGCCREWAIETVKGASA